jgi:transcriptional regulator with XRE-family HTH domain
MKSDLLEANIETSPQKNKSSKVRKPKGPSIFSKNLRNLLKAKKLSLREAARIAGVSPSVMSGWTAGSVPNDPVALLRLTDSLGVDFQMLLTGKPANPVPLRDIQEVFEVEEVVDFSGVFIIEAKRLKWRR